VYVDGFPEVRSYQAKDGSTKLIQCIRVTHIELLTWSEKNNEVKESNEVKEKNQPISSPYDDDLPF
jgi:single-stranded DNA-binding protein